MSPSWPEAAFDKTSFWPPAGGRVMWMRSCAVCKALLKKFRLSDSVRCQCGWQW